MQLPSARLSIQIHKINFSWPACPHGVMVFAQRDRWVNFLVKPRMRWQKHMPPQLYGNLHIPATVVAHSITPLL